MDEQKKTRQTLKVSREEISGYIALAMIATGGDDHPVMGSRVAGLEGALASQKETRLVCGRRRRERERGVLSLNSKVRSCCTPLVGGQRLPWSVVAHNLWGVDLRPIAWQ